MNAYIVVCNGVAWRIKADGYYTVGSDGDKIQLYRDTNGGAKESIAFVSGAQVVIIEEDSMDPKPPSPEKPGLATVHTHPAVKAD